MKQKAQDLSLPEAESAQSASDARALPAETEANASPTGAALMNKEDVPLEAEAEEAEATETAASDSAAPASAGQPAQAKRQRPSILYCVPANALDITSGAALSQRTLLASLASRGFRAVALEATIFDSPQGGEHVLKAGEAHKDKPLLRAMVKGVEHLMIRTKATRRGEMTCAEQEVYLRCFREQLHHRRPDMLFMWGGMLLEMTMMREAHEAGVPVVFYLVNGGYKNKDTFKYVSVVVTDTEATAKLYKERLGLDCKVVGKFIDPELVKPSLPRRPDFITFINPSYEKGVSVFMPMAKIAAKEAPDVRFLVVQSRGRWGNALAKLGFKPEDFPNVKVIGHQTDMRPVFASTKALLVPSLWHESGARVIAEAQINGIPIIASKSGGSPELVGEGGVILDMPQAVYDNKTTPAPEEVARTWLEEVKRIWRDDAFYQDLCRKVEKEAVQHDLARNTERFVRAVGPFVLASKGLGADGKPLPKTAAGMLQQALKKKQAQPQTKPRAKKRR